MIDDTDDTDDSDYEANDTADHDRPLSKKSKGFTPSATESAPRPVFRHPFRQPTLQHENTTSSRGSDEVGDSQGEPEWCISTQKPGLSLTCYR